MLRRPRRALEPARATGLAGANNAQFGDRPGFLASAKRERDCPLRTRAGKGDSPIFVPTTLRVVPGRKNWDSPHGTPAPWTGAGGRHKLEWSPLITPPPRPGRHVRDSAFPLPARIPVGGWRHTGADRHLHLRPGGGRRPRARTTRLRPQNPAIGADPLPRPAARHLPGQPLAADGRPRAAAAGHLRGPRFRPTLRPHPGPAVGRLASAPRPSFPSAAARSSRSSPACRPARRS